MPSPFRLVRFQESGLLLVILALGVLLTVFSGSVRVPLFTIGPDGARQRVFTTNANGEREPATVERNKFLNLRNLAQLAKDTSFVAIMAVGMSLVIIAGGIDLSVGAIYALASVLGALVLHHFGPEGSAAESSAWIGCLLGAGFSEAMTVHAYSVQDAYIYGFALQQADMASQTPEDFAAVARRQMDD